MNIQNLMIIIELNLSTTDTFLVSLLGVHYEELSLYNLFIFKKYEFLLN